MEGRVIEASLVDLIQCISQCVTGASVPYRGAARLQFEFEGASSGLPHVHGAIQSVRWVQDKVDQVIKSVVVAVDRDTQP